MPKIKFNFLSIALTFFIFSCGEEKSKNEIEGNWSAKYIIVGKTELLGYFESELTYSLKPTIFTKSGKMIVFLENEGKKNIEADYSIISKDSIEFKSEVDQINGVYKIEFNDEMGKLVMQLDGLNNKMFFERISGQIEF